METDTSTFGIIGETGIVNNFNHNSKTIFLDNNYSDPVIFAQPLSYNGQQAAIVRIEEIQEDRFTAFLQEPNNLDGKHINESFSYIVLEKGAWQLEDDTLLEVGTVNTDLLAPNGWENIDFNHDFADDPLVFSQVQTDNGRDFVRTRQNNTSTSGFQITMEEEEALKNSGHATETLGWFAISAGQGKWGQNDFQAGTTGNTVTHNWHTINFGNDFSQSPVLLASIATYDGADPSGLRYDGLSSDQVKLKIEEDTSQDTETSHTTEVVNFLAIAGNDSIRGVTLGENSKDNEENWDVIYDGLNQNQPLNIIGMNNVLIRNSTFNNIKSSDAIYIRNSDNVHIENVTINNTVDYDAIDIRYSGNVYIDEVVVNKVSGKSNLNGVKIWQSTNITVEDSKFSKIFSSGHSAGVKISPGDLSANITINNNHIYNTYGNGIVSGGSSNPKNLYVHDNPVPQLKITNNLIHDTGLTPTPVSGSPTHGMYIKAQDSYIANNTVYNSFDGAGISIRSTAIVKNNKIWDTKRSALAFYQQKPAGSSMKSIIENNELFFTENRPEKANASPLIRIYWSQKPEDPIFYDTFEVRNNRLSICTDANIGNPALMHLYSFKNLTIVGNDLIDRRAKTIFFRYIGNPSIRYEEQNTNSFNEYECSYV